MTPSIVDLRNIVSSNLAIVTETEPPQTSKTFQKWLEIVQRERGEYSPLVNPGFDDFEPLTAEQHEAIARAEPKKGGTVLGSLID